MPLAFAALAVAVAACSGAATVPSAAAPTTAPATPAATVEPVASATPEPVPSPTAAPAAVAGCLDSAVHAILYKGLKDPDSLTEDEIQTLYDGFIAWMPSEEQKDLRLYFLGQGAMKTKVTGAMTLRSGQAVIEACP
jgi:hypothetical protein